MKLDLLLIAVELFHAPRPSQKKHQFRFLHVLRLFLYVNYATTSRQSWLAHVKKPTLNAPVIPLGFALQI